MSWVVSASGTVTSVVGATDQILATDTTVSTYYFEVDLTAMAIGDVVECRIYLTTLSGGELSLAWSAVYGPSPPIQPISAAPVQPSNQNIEVAIRQTKGTAKAFSWKLLRQPGAGVIPYTATAPATLAATTGPVSPLGWTVDLFDDFNGTFTRTTNNAWVTSRGTPNCFTTGALYNGQPAVYGCAWNPAWGGYAGNDVITNVAMSGGDLIFNVTNVGGTITTSSVVMSFPSPWGLWEWNMKAAHGANGSRSGCNVGLWLSYYPWPGGAEIDVIETAVGSGTTGGITTTIHCGSGGGGVNLLSSAALPNNTHWDDGNYHTYGMLVTPSYLATYVDGVLMGSGHASTYLLNVNTATNPPNSSTQYTWGYHGNVIVGSPSSPSNAFNNNIYVIFGYEVTSGATTAVCPTSANLNWFRHSILNPATGGPHV